MIQLDSISKAYGGDQLFGGLDWKIPDDTIIGLVGANGVGKSTLCRIITGQEPADAGRVVIPQHTTVGYLPQEVTEVHQGTVLEVITDGAAELVELGERLDQLEAQLSASSGADAEQLSDEYGELQERFRRGGGYSIGGRARQIAAGLGFKADEFDRPLRKFSGGWRMRALVGRMLLSGPDVLLLDEPTNHLDLESLEWLEDYLRNYDGSIVLISHDRYFLNRLTDQVVELANRRVRTFIGSYDDYLDKRQALRKRLQDQRDQQLQEIERIEAFVERFRYQASKAAQVQSRVKMLEKIELVDVPPDTTPNISFEFPQPPRVGKRVVTVDGVDKAYGDTTVFEQLDLQVYRGDKLALVGPNGAGKSTLLKLLAKQTDADRGDITYGHRVDIAYFAQHSVDQLQLDRTVLAEMEQAASTEAFPKIRSVLGAFNFSEDDVAKEIRVLSGGEKSRLALAKMLLEPAGLLLLDEPTNHLDMTSRQMLEQALADFEGAFCVVSHDRYFLNAVVDKVIRIDEGRVTEYGGDYDYYRWKYDAQCQQQDPAPAAADPQGGRAGGELTNKEIRQRAAQIRRQRDQETRALRQEIDQLEQRIETAEQRHSELEAQLAEPDTYDDPELLARLNKEFKSVDNQLGQWMADWEKLAGELDRVETRYGAKIKRLEQ